MKGRSSLNRKPEWLSKKIDLASTRRMESLLKDMKLNTICQSGKCPNIGECFCKGTATFMILGDTCTRNCAFCGVPSGEGARIDKDEPSRVAKAVASLNLKHVVVTSVTRDDLPDGGAAVFADTIRAIRDKSSGTTVEVLIPDFQCNEDSIATVVKAFPDIIGHNIETVPRLYPEVRPAADYFDSLSVLDSIKKLTPSSQKIYTKSGIMLGLGEKEVEVIEVLYSLRTVDCDLLSIGQYLQPSKTHYPVKEYISPSVFEHYKEQAYNRGFKYVASGPYVRSSFLADEYLKALD